MKTTLQKLNQNHSQPSVVWVKPAGQAINLVITKVNEILRVTWPCIYVKNEHIFNHFTGGTTHQGLSVRH